MSQSFYRALYLFLPVVLPLVQSADLGFRSLATTWETDDDNSIMQLVAVPSSGSPAGTKVTPLGPFLWYDSPENSALELLPCAMAYGAAAAPGGGPAFFFATGNALGPVRIYTVDAVAGALLGNVSLTAVGSLALTAMAYNAATGELDALGYAGAAAVPQAVAIDPATGAVRVLVAQLTLPDFQGPCEAAVAPHARASSHLYFVQQDAVGWQRANTTYLMALNMTTGAARRLVARSPRDGMLSNVAAVDAAAPDGSELALFTTNAWDQDLNETAELTLWALDPAAAARPPAAVATILNPQSSDGPLLSTWGTLSVDGAGAQRTVSMLATNNNGRIFTYLIELNVTVDADGMAAAGTPVYTQIDDTTVTGGMIYRMNRVFSPAASSSA